MSQKHDDRRQDRPIRRDQRPVTLIDAVTKAVYVLIPAEAYQCVSAFLEADEVALRDTYPPQEQVAHAAGWDDPTMEVYNEYDRHCPSR